MRRRLGLLALVVAVPLVALLVVAPERVQRRHQVGAPEAFDPTPAQEAARERCLELPGVAEVVILLSEPGIYEVDVRGSRARADAVAECLRRSGAFRQVGVDSSFW